MPSRYPTFDRSRLRLLPLSQRKHDVAIDQVLAVGQRPVEFEHPELAAVADAMRQARARGSAIVVMMGAHVIKQGLSRYIIDLVRRGWVSVLACNGACTIHDFEMATMGATSESVARYISQGQFGLWQDTGRLNDIVAAGARDGLGLGEAVGRAVATGQWRGRPALASRGHPALGEHGPQGQNGPDARQTQGQDALATLDAPHKDASVFAAAYEAGVPATVHVGIGYDIIHQHPNCDGAAIGAASYRDFLIFAKVVENLEGGVLVCLGSAVMGPEVYLKALAMARNVAHQQGRSIRRITSAVFDLVHLGGDLRAEAPKDTPEYYYRPFKTILVRTVRDGGASHYIRGDHRATIPALHSLLTLER